MSSNAQLVLTALAVLIAFMVSYFWTRMRLPLQKRFSRTLFVLNMVILLVLVLVYQVRLLKRLDIYSTALIVSTIVMAVASCLHHLSIIFRHKAEKYAIIEKIHGPISHILFFIPFSVNAGAISTALFRQGAGHLDMVMSIVFVVSMSAQTIMGIGVALNKLQLPYR